MGLPQLWFILVAVLWSGYFLLEGFDFGVGMLLPFLPRDEQQRDQMLETIGPVWDGNEVWLVTAGGATFAAFPAWYATMFSGFYLALLLVLVFLILRVLSFEWRTKGADARWRRTWMWANAIGSFGAPLIWGVGLSALLYGVPIDSSGNFTGDLASLFSPYTVLGGVTVVLLFLAHGAAYLTIRTSGDLCDRAAGAARRLSPPAAVALVAFLAWTVVVAVDRNDRAALPPSVPAALGAVAVAAAVALIHRRRSGWAFTATAAATVLLVATIFTGLYPRVMVSSTAFHNSLTVANASSAHYTLAVMTVVAAVLVPVILVYQAWTYHVFRARVGGPRAPEPSPPEQAPAGARPATGA